MDAGSEGLIIDVRDNPGGLLRSSVDVVSLFVEDGLILSEIDGSGNKREWIARDDIPAFDIPLVGAQEISCNIILSKNYLD